MPELQKESFPVTGLACAACAVSVQSMLESQNGVASAQVNYGNKTLRLEYDQSVVDLETLRKTLQGIGYDFLTDTEDRSEKLEQVEHRRKQVLRNRLIIAVLFSVPVFLLSMVFHHMFPYQNYLLLILSLPVIFYSGQEFYPAAIRQARHGIFTMDSLVATGTGAAFLLSLFNTIVPMVLESRGIEAHVYYESAVIIITFILLGRFLEENVKAKASSAILKLTGLQPKKITVRRSDEHFEIPAVHVVPGDVVTIRLGDRVPVDGVVISGNASVDESALTGEPLPVAKEPGNQVFAGTLNRQGILEVEAQQPGNLTVLSRIIRLVDEAQSSKPPIQKFVDKIAGIFVPTVFILAALTFSGWLIFGHDISRAFVTTISVLVIACPCALGLATPMALIAGIGRGASVGMIIRNAQSLEDACKVDTVILDKTGTITSGKPSVSIRWLSGEKEYAALLYRAEKLSNHPLASAICNLLESAYPDVVSSHGDFESIEEIPGKGIKAIKDGKTIVIGSDALLLSQGVSIAGVPDNGAVNSFVYVVVENTIVAIVSVSDQIKPGSVQAVQEFNSMGIKTILVTGDTEKAAMHIAGLAGIEEVRHSILPDGKGAIVSKLQSEGRNVAMVGDGINDAYALAQADLGIAMGSGTDIAIESAGIILMKPELTHAVSAIRLSKWVVRIIHQNLFWAFFYNVIAIPLAAGLLYPVNGFLLNPMIAGAAMAMSSLTVVTNSLRLKRVKI
jgi:Cu2+-exporting ATPase